MCLPAEADHVGEDGGAVGAVVDPEVPALVPAQPHPLRQVLQQVGPRHGPRPVRLGPRTIHTPTTAHTPCEWVPSERVEGRVFKGA